LLIIVFFVFTELFLYRTLEERAKRLFATKDKSFEDLDPSLFMKDADKTKRGKFVFIFWFFLLILFKNKIFLVKKQYDIKK
jgi:hypothetical protein